jgi:hypothetical protein
MALQEARVWNLRGVYYPDTSPGRGPVRTAITSGKGSPGCLNAGFRVL